MWKFTKELLLSLSFFLFLSYHASAEQFSSALEKMLQAHPQIQQQLKNIIGQQHQYKVSYQDYRPEISANIGISRTDNDGSSASSSDFTSKTASINISQNIFNSGATIAAVEAGKVAIKLAEYNYSIAEQQLLLGAINAYIRYFRQKEILRVQKKNILRLERALEATLERQSVGAVTRTDTAQAKARLARANADYTSANNNLASAQAEFIRFFHEEASDALEKPAFLLSIDVFSFDSLWENVQKNNTQIILAKTMLDDIKLQKTIRSTGFLPTLDANLTLQKQHSTNTLQRGTTNSAQLGLTLNIPLYSQGVEHDALKAFDAAYQAAQRSIDNLERDLKSNLLTELANLNSAKAQIIANKEALEATKIALTGVQEEQIAGTRTVLDLLDAEQELLEAEVSFITSQYDVMLAKYQIANIMSNITPQALDINSPYIASINTKAKDNPFQPAYDYLNELYR